MCAQVIGKSEGWVCLGAQQTTTEQHGAILCAERSNTLLDFRAEVTHETLNGPSSGVTEGTNRATFDLFAGNCEM